MAVLGRLLVSSSERLDLPDLLSIDSYAGGDWKYFLKGMVGEDKPFILKGFDIIDPGNAIGTQSCSIRVADSVTFYPGSAAGAFFHGLQEGHAQAVPLVPELRKNAVNYVYLTFTTFNTSVDTRAFWDPDKDGGAGGEFTQDINTESVLGVQVNVSTGSFPANTIPVAKITVGPVVITAIEDARDLMFRLGTGGISPNPYNTYGWRSLPGNPYTRTEPPTTMLAGGVNPFQGADKNILTLKEWMDAVMSKLRELGGTTYWYDDTSTFGIVTNFFDAVATTFKSKGQWIHDTTTPGLLTWTEDIQIKMTSDPRTYIIRQGSRQLDDEQVLYIPMVRNQPINGTDSPVSWTNGQPYVNTIGGAVGLFANLAKGDYIKKPSDPAGMWVRVEEFYDAINLGGATTTAALARSVRLGANYLGATQAEKGRFDKGAYLPGDLTVSDRNDPAIATIGGNFHWLAIRSDVIENIGSIATTNLTLAIDQHDGNTARVTSTGPHGLVDGDRLEITGTTNFNGTHKVEVESTTVFYITVSGGPFADESGAGHYATVTTAARSTPYGFQEESANHGFNSDDTIIIDGTLGYDGSYKVNVTGPTTFTIPTPAPAASEIIGTATLAKVIVRTEGSSSQLIQGEVINIGGDVAENIRLFIGMDSLSQTAPFYAVAPSYNTLDGMANYNATADENLTARASKLTAMMADKAQDKTIKALPSSGIQNITNTTVGPAQQITFTPTGGSLTFMTPGSTGQAFVALPGTAPGISLLVNQVAYITIDRNAPTSPSIVVSNIADMVVAENTFVVAARLNDNNVYMWDGSIAPVGSIPGPGFGFTVQEQNQMLKLVAGGTWAWNGTTLSWSANANMQVPGLANTVNVIPAGSIALASGQVAYVDINRVAPGGSLTVTAAANATLPLTIDRFIIAREAGGDVIVGNHSMRLQTGESKALYRGTTDQERNMERGDKTGFFHSDQTVTWTSTQLEFTQPIVLDLHNTAGTLQQYSISAAQSPIVLANNNYAWIVVDRTQNTQAVTVVTGATLPAQPVAGTDVIPFLKRIDAGGEQFLHIPFHKQLLTPGQTVRLGASGSGGGNVKAKLLDPVNTSLPTGTSYVGDGVTGANGDLVLFTKLAVNNNQIYMLGGVGTSLTWTPQRSFNGQFSPTDGDAVRIQQGAAFGDQLAVFNGTNFLVNDVIRLFDGVSGNFWEQSSLKTLNLPNNASTNVFTVAFNGSQNMIVDYSLVRGGLKDTGTMIITTDGTTAKVSKVNSYIGTANVTFAASIVGLNLLLTATTDNSGAAATLKYFVKRWSDTAGGPTGIPNYNTGGGGGTTPAAGNLNEVQYNGPGGILAAEARFKWDGTNGAVNLNGLEIGALSPAITLADGQLSPVVISTYNATNYNFLWMDYSIVRGTDRRQGTVMITNNGTSLDLGNDFQESNPIGVDFTAAVNGANVEISYTSLSTGLPATMKYSFRRWT